MRPVRLLVLGSSLALGACARDSAPLIAPVVVTVPEPALGVSSFRQPVGSRVAVAVRLTGSVAGLDAVGAVQGWVHFDPAALRYLGQPGPAGPAVITGEKELGAGRLKFAAVDIRGLPEIATVFVFEVVAPNYAEGLAFEPEIAASRGGDVLTKWPGRVAAALMPDLVVPSEPRHLTLADWAAYLHVDEPPSRIQRLPGDGTVYGDVNLNGVINVLDVLATLNVAAGNLPLLSGLTQDFVVAADVAPTNSPGIGEASDPIPPGLEPNGTRNINVLDGLAIATFVSGITSPVVGMAIPGRTPMLGRAILTGIFLADRTLSRDTVYELNGTVVVPGGVTLTIAAGTRLEGQSATRGALSIRRNGMIQALGTRLEPIVFTCTSSTPAAGCWGGVNLNGAALLNNGNTGGGFVQCPEKQEPSGGTYGGCLVQHSSGVMRFVRIQFAGAPWPATSGPAPGLALNGVGSGTVLEDIQIAASSGDGVFVSGGRASIRELYLTHNAGTALEWDDGWQGKGQAVLIASVGGAGGGLRGSNAASNPTAGPRSHPTIYNVTIIETNPAGLPGLPAILLAQGTGGQFRNVIVRGWTGVGLEINDPATCARIAADSLDVSSSIFSANNPDFSADADCVDEAAYATDPLRLNLLADPALLDPSFALSPDFRPNNGSPADQGAMPPSDGFFDTIRTYRGAVPVATVTRSNIPWYAGWTVGL